FTILFLSELIFTIYRSVYDIDNFSGHLYKVVGYFFIMKAFYLSIEKQTLSENHYRRKGFQANDLLHEHPGLIVTVKKIGGSFIHCVCDGSLINELGLTPENVVGKTFSELYPANAQLMEQQYQNTWVTGRVSTLR